MNLPTKPFAQAFFLCDALAPHPQDAGKRIAIGPWTGLYFRKAPYHHGQFVLSTTIAFPGYKPAPTDEPLRTVKLAVQLRQPEGEWTQLWSWDEAPIDNLGFIEHQIVFPGIVIQRAGEHLFRLLVDDEVTAHCRFVAYEKAIDIATTGDLRNLQGAPAKRLVL